MATIVLRLVKGSALTIEELDNNFNNLNQQKLEASIFSGNNTVLIRDNSGNLIPVVIAEGEILGRLTGEEIKGLSAEELKGLLEIGVSDVAGLDTAISGPLADKADKSLLGGLSIVASGTDTLVAGVKAVAFAGILATDKVICFVQSPSSVGALYLSGIEATVGFTVSSTNVADTSTFFYLVLREEA